MVEFSIVKKKQDGKMIYDITERANLVTRHFSWTHDDINNLLKEICRTKLT